MRFIFTCIFAFSSLGFATDADYKLGPDSQPDASVPKGEVKTFTLADSKAFPGTTREWSLYIPKQYDPEKPACAMVFFDGPGYAKVDGGFRVPVVFDNLIAKREMPVTVAIFIAPGTVPSNEPGKQARSNRSYEYDSLGDLNARFLVEEIIPLARRHVNLTEDPSGWGLCGLSSSGIAAFTVAWEKPASFGKVISFIGSFTNIRGGYVYPGLIRKTKPSPKPIRVFLQDGSNDLDNLHGNWPLSNQEMAAALKFAGYDYKFELGTGSHSGKHGGAILPDALRWLWRDFPK